MLLVSIAVWAGPIKRISGTSSYFGQDITANYDIDFQGATWEEEEDYKTWCGSSYSERLVTCDSAFYATFNEHTRHIKLTDKEEAPYKLVIHVTNLERKQAGLLFGLFLVRIYGTFELIDLSTNEAVYSAKFAKVPGDPNFVELYRISNAFEALAKNIIDL